jgi:hypothetical protein
LERLKKNCSQFGARIFEFWRGWAKEQVQRTLWLSENDAKTQKGRWDSPPAKRLQYF